MAENANFEKIIELAIKRGFFYPSQEIYGGKSGFYDYGSLGKLLKKKWEDVWRKYFLNLGENFWEVEPSEIMLEKVFIASKHLENFNDPVAECEKGHRFRADKLVEEKLKIRAEGKSIDELHEIIKESGIRCPLCNSEIKSVKWFNLMFPIFVGPETGGFWNIIEELKRNYEKYERFLKIKKKLKEEKPLEITDGHEFITILKEVFEKDIKNVYYATDEEGFWIINVQTGEAIVIDLFTQEAKVWIKDREYKKYIEKYKDIEDLEKEFEEFLEKLDILFDDTLLEEGVERLVEEYNEMLQNRMFLRPETAQGPYTVFPREILIHRSKLPLGLAVIGKAFRNEISPRQGLLRLREFTQAELQIFFDKDLWNDDNFEKYYNYSEIKNEVLQVCTVEDSGKVPFKEYKVEEFRKMKNLPKFYVYFLYKVQEFYLDVLKIPKERFRLKELSEDEKAFYNKFHYDVELYLESIQEWKEVGGIHYRVIEISKDILDKVNKKVRDLLLKVFGDSDKIEVGYDLFNHLMLSENSGFVVNLPNGRKIIPVELELSFGVDRNVFSLIDIFYKEEEVNGEKRVVLSLPEFLSPIEVAVFPLLSNKKEHVEIAREVYERLKKDFVVIFDKSGSIGRRYRRQDEIGTPFCITIDDQTLQDNTVTVRFRDTMEQIRIKIDEINNFLWKKLR